MVEEAEYTVRITLTVGISFAPMERETPLTRQDAIENAYGSLPDGWIEAAEAEGFSVEAEAESA